MKPSIGRIVHYKTKDGSIFPAIIIAVVDQNDYCDISVFSNDGSVTAETNVAMANGPQEAGTGQWWWPERI